MQSRRRRSRLSRRRRQERKIALLCWAVPIALIAILVFLSSTLEQPVRREPVAVGNPLTVPIHPRADRPIYPYSILRGGAYDAEEFETKLHADPVAARHYLPFDLRYVRLVTLPAARLAYVSYRKGSDIYWTRKPVLLRAGETLLTDGKLLARARCGNRVSDTPQQPVADVPSSEPPELVMNTPQPPEVTPALTPSRGIPSANANPRPGSIKGVPDVGIEAISEPPSVVDLRPGPYTTPQFLPPPVAVVPEPNAFVLMGTAFLLCFAARWFRRRRS
jgi:hypothetical protein